jgi:hypothetical protein
MNGKISPLKTYNSFDMEMTADSIGRLAKIQLFTKQVDHVLSDFTSDIPFLTDVDIVVILGDKELSRGIDYVIYEEEENGIFKTKLKLINHQLLIDTVDNTKVKIYITRRSIDTALVYNALGDDIVSQENRVNAHRDNDYIANEIDGITRYVTSNHLTEVVNNPNVSGVWELVVKTSCSFQSISDLIKFHPNPYAMIDAIQETINTYDKFSSELGDDTIVTEAPNKKIILGLDYIKIVNLLLSDGGIVTELESIISADYLGFTNFLLKYSITLQDHKFLDARLYDIYMNPDIDNPINLGGLDGLLGDLQYHMYPGFTHVHAIDTNGTSEIIGNDDGDIVSPPADEELCVMPVVNTPPVANAQNVTTEMDIDKDIVLTGSDTDVTDVLTYTVDDEPTHGSLSGTEPNLTYIPDGGYYGPDSFTFIINDGYVDSLPATVDITVNEVFEDPFAIEYGLNNFAASIAAVNQVDQTLNINMSEMPYILTGITIEDGYDVEIECEWAHNYNGKTKRTMCAVSNDQVVDWPPTMPDAPEPYGALDVIYALEEKGDTYRYTNEGRSIWQYSGYGYFNGMQTDGFYQEDVRYVIGKSGTTMYRGNDTTVTGCTGIRNSNRGITLFGSQINGTYSHPIQMHGYAYNCIFYSLKIWSSDTRNDQTLLHHLIAVPSGWTDGIITATVNCVYDKVDGVFHEPGFMSFGITESIT